MGANAPTGDDKVKSKTEDFCLAESIGNQKETILLSTFTQEQTGKIIKLVVILRRTVIDNSRKLAVFCEAEHITHILIPHRYSGARVCVCVCVLSLIHI